MYLVQLLSALHEGLHEARLGGVLRMHFMGTVQSVPGAALLQVARSVLTPLSGPDTAHPRCKATLCADACYSCRLLVPVQS